MKIAQNNAIRTIDKVVDKYKELIAPTYGPAGKKVLIAHSEFNIKAVDDGFEGVKEFELENEFENAVLLYIKETTARVNNLAGDGTTTAGLLMTAIFKEVLGNTKDPMVTLKKNYVTEIKGIEEGIKEAVKYIKDNAKKIKSKQELYNIAYNSYNNEPIALLISETLFKIGAEGLLAIGDSQTSETTVEKVKGLEIEKGYASPYFINSDNEVILSDTLVIPIVGRLESFKEIFPLLDTAKKTNPRITIIAEGFSEEVLNMLILAKMQGSLSPLLIETPGFGDNKLESLKNIAVICGTEVLDPKITDFKDVTQFGSAKKLIATKDKTTIINGAGNRQDIGMRVVQLSKRREEVKAPYEKEQLTKYIATLQGGMALIKVGASTENEQKAVKAKVEDSINATKLAFKDGIVKGAGKTYGMIKTKSDILNRALKAPSKQLEENGAEYLDVNVTDPAGVLVVALETAGSIACGLLSISAIITTKREEKNDKVNF